MQCTVQAAIGLAVSEIRDNKFKQYLTLSWPAGHNVYVPLTKSLFKSAGKTVSHFFSVLPSIYLEVSLFRWTSQNAFFRETAVYKWYCLQWCLQHCTLYHLCTGKCILTGSTEERYFKVDGSMEKKWDTVIPADLKRLFVSGTYMSRWSRKG